MAHNAHGKLKAAYPGNSRQSFENHGIGLDMRTSSVEARDKMRAPLQNTRSRFGSRRSQAMSAVVVRLRQSLIA